MAVEFDWDDHNRGHLARHNVTPEEFEECFFGPKVEQVLERSGEVRVAAVGKTKAGRYLSIVYTMRRGHVRPVTAYTLPRRRRRCYEERISKG